jgi:aspartate/methionine/tyrosine aminotransferase
MSPSGTRFSNRTAWDLRESDLAAAIRTLRTEGRPLIDLTVSNPTLCGFDYDADAILAPLRSPKALIYDPDPRGMASAREAVATYYFDHGATVDPASILLTTSTSEAYTFLFRLLCDAGDEVLVAQPSYPLFDFLATLDDIQLRTYPLFSDFGWWIDFAELERRIGPRTRAILVVHPNNPTGHWTHRAERERLEALCVRHNLALIVDEVFLDYPIAALDPTPKSFATGKHPALTFVLSGVSKVAALPQMKVAWLAAFGPEPTLSAALSRLEVIADTFLSMNAPAQLALPAWLAGRGAIQRQIASRTGANLGLLREAGIELLRVEAGWSVVALLRLRSPEESPIAEVLLHHAGVIVHPGTFYGLPDLRMIVLSLLTPSGHLKAGATAIQTIHNAENPDSNPLPEIFQSANS